MGKKKQIKKTLVYPVAFFLLVAVSLVYKYILNDRASGMVIKKEETVASEEIPESNETSIETELRTCQIYICGAVNEPGVLEMPCGSILNDAVQLAGGLREDAPAERINLVYELNENISVYIPTKEELESGISCDPLIIRTTDNEYTWGTAAQDAVQVQEETSGLVNINTATRDQLMTLPGIGEATADAIIAYREETPFTSTQDITNVSGIGESKYNRIKDLICV